MSRKWITRSMAMRRSTMRSRRGLPRSGSAMSSRAGGKGRVGADGGARGSQESQRRQRYQRSASSESRANSSSSGGAPQHRCRRARVRRSHSRSARSAAPAGTASPSPCPGSARSLVLRPVPPRSARRQPPGPWCLRSCAKGARCKCQHQRSTHKGHSPMRSSWWSVTS